MLIVAACSGSDAAQIGVDGSDPVADDTRVDTTIEEPVAAGTQPPTTEAENPKPRRHFGGRTQTA